MSILPQPPTKAEQQLYSGGHPRLYICSIAGVRLISQAGVLWFILHVHVWWLLPYSMLMMAYLLGFLAFGLQARPFYYKLHRSFVDSIISRNVFTPSVDVFIPTCGEETAVVLNTVRHALVMQYAGVMQVYVLDDGANDVLRVSTSLLPNSDRLTYLSRPNRGEGKKGGNLRYGFARSNGELIAIFDADFAAAPNFLNECVPYFLEQRLGILQTPQYFRQSDQSNLLSKGIAYALEQFYRFVQVARNGANSATCCGTNLLYRRSALVPHGGTIQVEHGAEDRHTAWAVQNDGWAIQYIPVPLAAGLCPDTINAIFTQAYRWANGATVQLLSREYWSKCPLWCRTSKLTWLNWLAFGLSALSFTVESLPLWIGSIPIVYLYGLHPELVNFYTSLVFLPLLLWLRLVTPIVAKARWNIGVLISGVIICNANLLSVISVLRGQRFQWITTGDRSATAKTKLVNAFKRGYPFFAALQITLVTGFALRAMLHHYAPQNFAMGLLIVLLNMITLGGVLIYDLRECFNQAYSNTQN